MSKLPISREGHEALRSELEQLAGVERPRVVEEVAFAAAQGDRSENAEYIYGKKRLREIDRRLRFLQKRLDGVMVVDGPPPDTSVARFGATVELSGSNGRTMVVTLVGNDEIDPARGRISLKSPLGEALLGHREGESVQVSTPRGPVTWTLSSIRYQAGI